MGMRRRLATVALLLLVIGACAAVAAAEVVRKDNVQVSFHAKFAPQSLPRDRPAPISVEVDGQISSTDGSQPPPLQKLRLELTSYGQIDTRGLAACPASALQSTSSEVAIQRCGPAQVGRGKFQADLQFSGRPILVDGRALVFNGVVDGRPGMFIHIYISRPVTVTLVIPLKISHRSGRFGTVLTTRVPKLAGGFGSITELQLQIGRQYSYRGERHSYLSAACAAPAGFPGATFTFAHAVFSFGDGLTMNAFLSRRCQVRD
jgi:hypothetical protein